MKFFYSCLSRIYFYDDQISTIYPSNMRREKDVLKITKMREENYQKFNAIERDNQAIRK